MTFPSHVVDDFIPEKMRCMKNLHWNLFPHFDATQEELVPVMYLNNNYHFPVGDVVFVTTGFFFFHMSHNDGSINNQTCIYC